MATGPAAPRRLQPGAERGAAHRPGRRGDGGGRPAVERRPAAERAAGRPGAARRARHGPGPVARRTSRACSIRSSRRAGRHGLGLALVHRAVEAHRGAILVDGAPEGGACFTIYLPAHAGGSWAMAEQRPGLRRGAAPRPDHRRRAVDPRHRADPAARRGLRVETMQNPREALARWTELAAGHRADGHPHARHERPGGAGRVREHDVEIPVILMTAQASLQTRHAGGERGRVLLPAEAVQQRELVALCRRAAETRLLSRENKALKREIRRREDHGPGGPSAGTARSSKCCGWRRWSRPPTRPC
jgi:hypothetical protein